MSPSDETLVIERIVPGGRGFARSASGLPVFVRGGLPGDRLRAEQVRDKRSFLEVERFSLLEAGPERVPPSCVDEARCGGCDLMRLERAAQHQVKIGILREALMRTGGFQASDLPAIRLQAPGPELGYRLRVRLQVQAGKVGFFSSASHELIEVEACQVASPEVRTLLGMVRECVRSHSQAFADVESIEARVLPPGLSNSPLVDRSSVFLALTRGKRPSAALGLALELLEVHARVSVAGEHQPIDQKLWVTDDVFVASPIGGFCQVHQGVNRALVSAVLELARSCGARNFLDLYSGSGNFSLPLAHAGLSGLGIELSRDATEAAVRGARAQALKNVEFRSGDVARAVAQLVSLAARYDLIVVDPPRAGARDVVRSLVELGKTLVMVSCDPVTLARDLKELVSAGAVIERLEAWDMFPQTHHVETLCVLNCAAAGAC